MLKCIFYAVIERGSFMDTAVKDLTKGSLWSGIFFFSLPLIMSNLLQILFNMSDIAVVGRFSGAIALGAVGSTTTLVSLFTSFLIGIGGGVNVIVAQALGRGDSQDIRRSVHTALLLCIAIGIIVMIFGELANKWILEVLKTKEELIAGAMVYLRIYFLGMPALAVYNFGNAVFSAAGDTRKPLLFLSIAGVLNIILNLFFVIVLKIDVAGVAIASITSQYFSATAVIIALMRLKGDHGLRPEYLKADPLKAKKLLYLCLPAGIQNAIFQIANLFVQFGVNSFSATVVAGNAAAQNADGLSYDVSAAFYTACGSYIGQNYGAGNVKRIKKAYYISLLYAFVSGTAIGIALAVFSDSFLSLFTNDPEVLAAGRYRLTVMGFSYGFSAFMDNAIAASRGLGKGVAPTVIVILGSCVFRIVWIFTVFAHFKTITSLYLLYIFSWSITGLAEALYFHKSYREIEARMAG